MSGELAMTKQKKKCAAKEVKIRKLNLKEILQDFPATDVFFFPPKRRKIFVLFRQRKERK